MPPLVISLTSIPPRFGQLPRTVAALRAQTARARILLVLPSRYRRFPGHHAPPPLEGVEILRPEGDPGPIAKLAPAVRLLRGEGSQDCHLLYCDDDWLYGPGWAQGFLDTARARPGAIVAASTFSARRLGLSSPADSPDIAQGFAGVMLRPDWLDEAALAPPPEAWAVDDIWLSAQYARLGRRIVEACGLRAHAAPLSEPDRLQDARLDGADRATANRRLAQRLAAEYGIWGAVQD